MKSTKKDDALIAKIVKDPSEYKDFLRTITELEINLLSIIEKKPEVVRYLNKKFLDKYADQILNANGFAISAYTFEDPKIEQRVLIAVKQNGLALEVVPPTFKNNVPVVVAAAKQNLRALQSADQFFWQRPEGKAAVLEIIKDNEVEGLQEIKNYILPKNYNTLIAHRDEQLKQKQVNVLPQSTNTNIATTMRVLRVKQEEKQEQRKQVTTNPHNVQTSATSTNNPNKEQIVTEVKTETVKNKTTQVQKKRESTNPPDAQPPTKLLKSSNKEEPTEKEKTSEKTKRVGNPQHVINLTEIIKKAQCGREGNFGNEPKHLAKMFTILLSMDMRSDDRLTEVKKILDNALSSKPLSRTTKVQTLYLELKKYFDEEVGLPPTQEQPKKYNTPFARLKNLFGSHDEDDSIVEKPRKL